MMTGNIRDFVPQLRPHNNRRDNHVHFMISRRPMLELSPEDVSFYDSIDGHKTVGELERHIRKPANACYSGMMHLPWSLFLPPITL